MLRSTGQWRVAAVGVAFLGGTIVVIGNEDSVYCAAAATSKNDEANYELAQRFKCGLNARHLRLRKDYDKGTMKTYSVRTQNGFNFGKGGLPLARVATIEISAPVDEIVLLVENAPARKEWDVAHCSESRQVTQGDPKSPTSHTYNYFCGKPGWLVAARDFVYSSSRLSPAIMSINNFRSVVLLNIDESARLPASWRAVRARQNSCYILEPLSASRTLCTYMVETSVGGWAAWLDTATIDLFAGDSMLLFLLSLKSFVERQKSEADKMTVEEAARVRFQRNQRLQSERALVDDLIVTSKADLKETARLLELQLANLAKEEKASGLDFSGLRAKLQADLRTAREQIKRA